MQIAILYATSCVLFLILDAIMLTYVMRPLFVKHLGDQMLPDLRLIPAALFYFGYVAGLTYLVSWPALKSGAPGDALIPAAVIGAMAYGTYEFTSYSILRDWDLSMVATDFVWGTVLTAFSAWAGVVVTRMITG